MEYKLIEYAVELLVTILKYFPPTTGNHEVPSDWISIFKSNPERLFQDARDRVRARDYNMAHKLFKLAEEMADPENTKPLPDKTKFSFYVLWSGIQCAYILRGDRGRTILCKYREKIDKLLKDYFPAKDPSLQVIEAYLYYMKGLTFGLDVSDKGANRRKYQTLADETKCYEEALERLANSSITEGWAEECRSAIIARKKRVERLQV